MRGDAPGRTGRPRRHRRPDVPRPDRQLRPLPRSQVRPHPQTDYYRLPRPWPACGTASARLPSPRRRRRAKLRRARRSRRRLAEPEEPARKRPGRAEPARPQATADAAAAGEWDFRRAASATASAGCTAAARRRPDLDADGLRLDGKTGYVPTTPLRSRSEDKTLEAWVRLDNLEQRGGGVMSVQTLDGVGLRRHRLRRAASRAVDGRQRRLRAHAESSAGRRRREADSETVHVAVDLRGRRHHHRYRNGQPYGKPYRAAGRLHVQGRRGRRSSSACGTSRPAATDAGRDVVRGPALRPRPDRRRGRRVVPAGSAHVSRGRARRPASPGAAQRSGRLLRSELGATARRPGRRRPRRCEGLRRRRRDQPEPTHLLLRGDVADAGERGRGRRAVAVACREADFG